MGFLIKHLYILLPLFLLTGCIPSQIKLQALRGDDSKAMFGSNTERQFISNESLPDSLIELWEYSTNGSFPTTMITVYDSFAFVNDLSGRVYCLNINSGKRIGQVKNKGSVYTAPVIRKSLMIYAAAIYQDDESRIIFYDILTGQIKEEPVVKGLVITELVKFNDGVVFTTERGIVYKFNFVGHKVWEINTKVNTRSSPSANENYFLFGNDDGEIICVDHQKGEIVYRIKTGHPVFSGTSIKDAKLYTADDSGVLYKIDINTGVIENKYDTGKRILMYPSIESDNIFIGNLNGELFALSLVSFEQKWKLITDGVFNTSPLITSDKLIVADLNKKIYVVDKKNGKILQTYNLDGRVKHTPIIVDGKLLVGFDNGIIKAYEMYH